MAPNYTNLYDKYVAENLIVDEKKFNQQLTPSQISDGFIPCDIIDNFYNDTLFYMHLYNTLYLALLKNTNDNASSITIFKDNIDNLKIVIDSQTACGSNTLCTYTTYSANNAATTALFTFYLKCFIDNGNDVTNTTTYSNFTGTQYTNHFPILTNITNTLASYSLSSTYTSSSGATIKNTKSTINEPTTTFSTTYNNDERAKKLHSVLYDILHTPHENILSYLLYNKLTYNVYLYHINIQKTIRTQYLNNSNITMNTLDYFVFPTSGSGAGATIISSIKTAITNMKTNITSLETKSFINNDYTVDKYKYTTKIKALEELKNEYTKIQNSLNISVKEYNKYIDNFTSIKIYANYIIIFLIILIFITIVITILTSITQKFKNSYYIITFIILAIITYLFYNRFNHVNLYEKFTTCNDGGNTAINTYRNSVNSNKKNHYALCNNLVSDINTYTDAVKTLTNSIRNNIYTIGNKVFSSDANTYLYKLYLEKKNLNEVNRLKKVSLTNLIESMKKQILYLFNIILLLSCLTIILLFGLVLHSSYPFLITYIVIVCVVLIIILVIYFMIAIIEPTRMIANKNYHANNRPRDEILKKL